MVKKSSKKMWIMAAIIAAVGFVFGWFGGGFMAALSSAIGLVLLVSWGFHLFYAAKKNSPVWFILMLVIVPVFLIYLLVETRSLFPRA